MVKVIEEATSFNELKEILSVVHKDGSGEIISL